MDKSQLKEQVETIREAFGYITRFTNRTFVLKIDGALINHPFFPLLIKDIVQLHRTGIKIVLVPGARTRIDEVLSTYNVECKTVDGIRVSTPKAIPFIKMAAFDVSNKIMTLLAENNTWAIIGNWVHARGIGVRDGVDFQHSGLVEKVQTGLINSVLEQGLVPIFPNIGWSTKGKPYNISADELAYTISVELGASKLFYITDKEPLSAQQYKLPKETIVAGDATVSKLRVDEAAEILKLNPMPKHHDPSLFLLSLAVRACNNGVDRVHILDGRNEGVLLKEIFSNQGVGTMVYANQHENIRQLTFADIPEILRIMQPLIDEGILVPRTRDEIEMNIREYVVYEVDNTVHASGALRVYPEGKGEIYGLAVDENYASMGTGRKVVSYLIDRAREMKLKEVFVLTTQAADWFLETGFKQATPAALPAAKKKAYDKRRRSLVLVYQMRRRAKRAAIPVE